MKSGGGCGVITAFFLIIFMAMIISDAFEGASSSAVAPAGQPAQQIQPQGFPERDLDNSRTNVNNAQAAQLLAEADRLRAEAERLRTISPAEAEVLYAQSLKLRAEAEKLSAEACDIRNDCGLFNYLSGKGDGVGQVFAMIGVFFVGMLGAAFVYRMFKGS